jgi:hypothetical protein
VVGTEEFDEKGAASIESVYSVHASFRVACVKVLLYFHRPFGLCYEVLTTSTVQKYFLPIVVSIKHISFFNFLLSHISTSHGVVWLHSGLAQ